MKRAFVMALTLALTGCPKDDPPKADASTPPATSSVAPQASAAPSASATTMCTT